MPFKDSMQARRVAHESWAKTPDRAARTAPGREKALANLEDAVDPERTMKPSDRKKAAENLRRARLLKANEKSVASRKARKDAAAKKAAQKAAS
jgi:hypothetical protein